MVMPGRDPHYRSGGEILADALILHGVERVFCVAGESYLGALDALVDRSRDVQVITCRHEAAAANMAEVEGKLTGRPGICFVSRGPGACHASIGVHTAFHDSTPMILFVGQVARDHLSREAFQEVDFVSLFAPLAKYVEQVNHPARLPEILNRAFSIALGGRAGPVVIVLPEDVLTQRCEVDDAIPAAEPACAPSAAAMQRLQTLLADAEKPLLLLGGSRWTQTAHAALHNFVERFDLPVCTAFRRKDLFPNHHDNYVGDVGLSINPSLAERMAEADLIVALGARLDDNTTGSYTRLTSPMPRQTLVHVLPSPEELNRVFRADVPILATPHEFLSACESMLSAKPPTRSKWRRTLRAEYERFCRSPRSASLIDLSAVFAQLSEILPDDAMIANGAGNYAGWLHRFYQYRAPNTLLGPTSGAMGYGIPAAIAGKIIRPERTVIAVDGDGCFLMSGQEIATAVQHRAPIGVIVVNNGSYGTIRMHQEKHYPGRVVGTDLINPDFVAFAQAFGFMARRVTTTDAFSPALRDCLAQEGPWLIELRTSIDEIVPGKTIAEIQGAA
jgi:acetolactate synthase-1/2/3 large subunit